MISYGARFVFLRLRSRKKKVTGRANIGLRHVGERFGKFSLFMFMVFKIMKQYGAWLPERGFRKKLWPHCGKRRACSGAPGVVKKATCGDGTLQGSVYYPFSHNPCVVPAYCGLWKEGAFKGKNPQPGDVAPPGGCPETGSLPSDKALGRIRAGLPVPGLSHI